MQNVESIKEELKSNKATTRKARALAARRRLRSWGLGAGCKPASRPVRPLLKGRAALPRACRCAGWTQEPAVAAGQPRRAEHAGPADHPPGTQRPRARCAAAARRRLQLLAGRAGAPRPVQGACRPACTFHPKVTDSPAPCPDARHAPPSPRAPPCAAATWPGLASILAGFVGAELEVAKGKKRGPDASLSKAFRRLVALAEDDRRSGARLGTGAGPEAGKVCCV